MMGPEGETGAIVPCPVDSGGVVTLDKWFQEQNPML